MTSTQRERIELANQQAFQKMIDGQPIWVDIQMAGKVVPGFEKNLILHAGPKIPFDNMLPTQQGGVIGGILFEGLARDPTEARQMIHSGEIQLAPGLDYGVPSGAMASTSWSMPVNVVEDFVNGSRGFTALQEGPATEALRWGVYSQAVLDHWRWLAGPFALSISQALHQLGGINLRTVIARSIQMGDENHSRELATNLLLTSELAAPLANIGLPSKELASILRFLHSSERFALHVLMAASSAVLQSIKDREDCTIVTAMGGNGMEIGIKVSALGDRWFTAPAPVIQGKYLNPAWKPEDTVPFAGDSCVMETYGLGGMAAAASPQVSMLIGGTIQDALNRTRDMWAITTGKNPQYRIPLLEFEGTPTGIDVIKVLSTGIEPRSHAGIALKKGGQAGAGVARIPMDCFKEAFREYSKISGKIAQ